MGVTELVICKLYKKNNKMWLLKWTTWFVFWRDLCCVSVTQIERAFWKYANAAIGKSLQYNQVLFMKQLEVKELVFHALPECVVEIYNLIPVF